MGKCLRKVLKKHDIGFSIVEILVVVAVIGIISAISIAFISGINRRSLQAKNQRNAQSLVSMAASARAAGAELPGAPEVEDVVEALSNGVSAPDDSSMRDTIFRVPNLSPDDITGAAEHLEWDTAGACLAYKPVF